MSEGLDKLCCPSDRPNNVPFQLLASTVLLDLKAQTLPGFLAPSCRTRRMSDVYRTQTNRVDLPLGRLRPTSGWRAAEPFQSVLFSSAAGLRSTAPATHTAVIGGAAAPIQPSRLAVCDGITHFPSNLSVALAPFRVIRVDVSTRRISESYKVVHFLG